MRWRLSPWLLALCLVAGCGGEPSDDTAVRSDSLARVALRGIPLVPGGEIADLAGTGEAGQVTLRVAQPRDSVAAWYRRTLIARGWRIVSDARIPGGDLTLHATDTTGRAVWLIMAGDPGGRTLVTVIGAAPDPAAR